MALEVLLVVLLGSIIALGLSAFVVLSVRHRDGQARIVIAYLFGSGAVWAWYVVARNLFDPQYSSAVWAWGNIPCAILAVWALYKAFRFLTK